MIVTVCELPGNWTRSKTCWHQLAAHLEAEKSDLLLLPEMPFFEWIARDKHPDHRLWDMAVKSHEDWITRLGELPVETIAASRPITTSGKRLNNGFVFNRQRGMIPVHDKYYLPDEPGYYEASWYEKGDGSFDIVRVNGVNIGFLICTELWFTSRAREYLAQDIDILLCPRATPESRVDIWVTGGRAAAIVSGAFCLSSNYNGPNTRDENFGGSGWIIEPERGEITGLTSADSLFLTRTIDIRAARAAKKTYPRYVKE